jgi:hypothetical protein
LMAASETIVAFIQAQAKKKGLPAEAYAESQLRRHHISEADRARALTTAEGCPVAALAMLMEIDLLGGAS